MVGSTNVHILTYLIYDDHLKTTHFHLAMCHYSNQLLYTVVPALDAVDVAELQVECTHKILLAIPALSNGVLSHLAKVDEHMHWLVWSKHR